MCDLLIERMGDTADPEQVIADQQTRTSVDLLTMPFKHGVGRRGGEE